MYILNYFFLLLGATITDLAAENNPTDGYHALDGIFWVHGGLWLQTYLRRLVLVCRMASGSFHPVTSSLPSRQFRPITTISPHHDNFAPSRQFRPIKYNTFTPTFTAPIISTPFYMIKHVPSLTKKNLFYQNTNWLWNYGKVRWTCKFRTLLTRVRLHMKCKA